MGSIQNLDVQIPHEIIQYWGWFLAFGIALLLLGVVAIVRSVTATIVSMLFFGWLLVLASIVLLPSPAARAAFVFSGLAVELLGLALVFRSHSIVREKRG